MGLLKVHRADLVAWDVSGERKHRCVTSMSIVQAIDQMHVSWSTTTRARREVATQLRFCTGRKCGFLFVTDMDPLQLTIVPYGVYDRIQAISDDTIDSLHPGLYQVFYKDISDRLMHVSLLLL